MELGVESSPKPEIATPLGFAANTIRQVRSLLTRLVGVEDAPSDGEQLSATIAPPTPWWRRRKLWLLALGPICFVLIYGLLLRDVIRNWRTFPIELVWQINLRFVLGASLIQIVGYLAVVGVWALLVKWAGYQLPPAQHLKLYAYSRLSERVPILFSGILTRVYLYHRRGVPSAVLLLLTVIEAIIVAIAGSLVYLGTTLLAHQAHLPALIGVGVVVVVGLALLHPRSISALVRRYQKTAPDMPLIQLGWRRLGLGIACHAGVIVLGGICLFLVISSITPLASSSLVVTMQAWSLTLVWGVALWWLPVNMGLRDGPFVFLLSTLLGNPVLLILLVLWRIWALVMEVFWSTVGLLVALVVERRRRGG